MQRTLLLHQTRPLHVVTTQQPSERQDNSLPANPLADLARGLTLIGSGVMMIAQGAQAVDTVLQHCALHSNS